MIDFILSKLIIAILGAFLGWLIAYLSLKKLNSNSEKLNESIAEEMKRAETKEERAKATADLIKHI